MNGPDEKEVLKTAERLQREAEASGYHLNPDREFTLDLVRGILTNQERYGYWCCPCRRAAKDRTLDLDIICPCDYRDPDLDEFGMCYCSLYVSEKVLKGEVETRSIPERRPSEVTRKKAETKPAPASLPFPVWRCKVCGYLCAREHPPGVCPICKADKDRFEVFMGGAAPESGPAASRGG